jgi:hypothetical protein
MQNDGQKRMLEWKHADRAMNEHPRRNWRDDMAKPWNPEDYWRETGLIHKCVELELEGSDSKYTYIYKIMYQCIHIQNLHTLNE